MNRFEFIGISLSVLAMAGALWLINLQSTADLAETAVPEQVAGIVVVGDNENQAAAIATAVTDAAGPSGRVERLIVDDIIIGDGEEVGNGDMVTVNYIGTLENGQEFDNSYERGTPFTFTLGEGRVIDGWEQGVAGMKVGGQRILVIPPSLGYGSNGAGPIPGNATLVFAVELLSVQ